MTTPDDPPRHRALDDELASDPPRLRTLGDELPHDLALALRRSADEPPTALEIAALTMGLRRAIEREPAPPTSTTASRRRHVGLRPATLVMTFALGAGAGIAVSGVSYWVLHGGEQPATPRGETHQAAPSSPLEAAPGQRAGGNQAPAPLEPTVSRTPDPTGPSVVRGPAPARDDVTPLVAETAPAGASPGELSLLARAQASLAGDPLGAHTLVKEHERTFPRGVLVQEREVIAIDALLRLGQEDQARARAERFHRAFPTSAHRRRVDVLLDVRKVPPADQK